MIAPPLSKKVNNPVTKRAVDFSKTPTGIWRSEFHAEMRKTRKVALRLGYLNEESGRWILKEDPFKKILRNELVVSNLSEGDVHYKVDQKGVDMRIGLDIASLTFKRLVDQIILVAGDSDFVPAAKLARREGIDFILDPMGKSIRPDLHEHSDVCSIFMKNAEQSSETDDFYVSGTI